MGNSIFYDHEIVVRCARAFQSAVLFLSRSASICKLFSSSLVYWREFSRRAILNIYSRHTNIYRVPEPPQKNDTARDRWNTRKFQVVRLNFLLFFVERLDFNDYGWICMINRE